jgi:hypothetical protein
MEQFMINLCIFVGICALVYLVNNNTNSNYSNSNYSNSSYFEGMTSDISGNPPSTNGIAGNAAAYAAQIKSQAIKIEDQLLISKYRTDYENVILNLDELVNDLMLQTALTVDQTKPQQSMIQLSQLQQAKAALNSTMKYIDSSK